MKDCLLCKLNSQDVWIKEGKHWNLGVCLYPHTCGALVIVSKEHKEKFSEITEEEVLEMLELEKLSEKILNAEFQPDWYNVQQNGNWEHHLHLQVLPRYKEKREFDNRVFEDKTFGQPVEYTSTMETEERLKKMTEILKGQLPK